MELEADGGVGSLNSTFTHSSLIAFGSNNLLLDQQTSLSLSYPHPHSLPLPFADDHTRERPPPRNGDPDPTLPSSMEGRGSNQRELPEAPARHHHHSNSNPHQHNQQQHQHHHSERENNPSGDRANERNVSGGNHNNGSSGTLNLSLRTDFSSSLSERNLLQAVPRHVSTSCTLSALRRSASARGPAASAQNSNSQRQPGIDEFWQRKHTQPPSHLPHPSTSQQQQADMSADGDGSEQPMTQPDPEDADGDVHRRGSVGDGGPGGCRRGGARVVTPEVSLQRLGGAEESGNEEISGALQGVCDGQDGTTPLADGAHTNFQPLRPFSIFLPKECRKVCADIGTGAHNLNLFSRPGTLTSNRSFVYISGCACVTPMLPL